MSVFVDLVGPPDGLAGWLLGASVGLGTLAVILLLGPVVDVASRLLRLDVHQGRDVSAGSSPPD